MNANSSIIGKLNTAETIQYQAAITSEFGKHTFTRGYVNSMRNPMLTMIASEQIADEIAIATPNQVSVNGQITKRILARMEAIASSIKFGGVK